MPVKTGDHTKFRMVKRRSRTNLSSVPFVETFVTFVLTAGDVGRKRNTAEKLTGAAAFPTLDATNYASRDASNNANPKKLSEGRGRAVAE